jgi:serine/threonine-protein kinase
VIQRALAKTPEERYPSAGDMAAALREAIGQALPQTAAVAAIDTTVVAVRSRGPSLPPAGAHTIDPVLLSNIERSLAERLGPIARYLVQTALPTAATPEALCDVLAQRIDRPDDRNQFLAKALGAARSGTSGSPTTGSGQSQTPTPSAIPPDEIERARRALAEALGPIAKVLVQRALPQARNIQQL